ncbi:MAG: hypothetical protein LBJ35_03785 [Spirochaetaceae bacterium]|jgi:hypothetical protein|nr:hypothetical protein [Spirochaetaceae bacterium]
MGAVCFFALLFLAVMSGLSIPLMFVRKKIEPKFPTRLLEGFSITFKDLISALKSGKLPINVSVLKTKWIWNIIIALWGLAGVGFIAYITSTVTTIMTTSVLSQTAIESLHELGNSRIGVVKGSIGEIILEAGC